MILRLFRRAKERTAPTSTPAPCDAHQSLTIRQMYTFFATCLILATNKNADYGDSWRKMRSPSITDQMRVKIERITQLEKLEENGLSPSVSEGIASELRDIANYAAMCSIKREEEGRNG